MKLKAVLTNKIFLVGTILVIIGICYLGNLVRKVVIETKISRLCSPENIDALKKVIKDDPGIVKQKFERLFNESDISLVHFVSWNFNLEGIKYLKSLDADFSLETSNGNTPLIILSRTDTPNGLECIKEVLGSKFVDATSITLPNRWGRTPIWISVSLSHPLYLKEYLRVLKANGVKVDKNSLLQFAVGKLNELDECLEIVSLLVSEGASPSEKNSEGKSSLDIAQERQKSKFLEIMAKK